MDVQFLILVELLTLDTVLIRLLLVLLNVAKDAELAMLMTVVIVKNAFLDIQKLKTIDALLYA